MPRRFLVFSLAAAPMLGALIAGAAAPSARAAVPADLASFSTLEWTHADDGWQRQDYVRFARGELGGELVAVAAVPGAPVVLDDSFTARTALRQFGHNVGAEPVGGMSPRVDTFTGTFFWQAYRLRATGESCAAFDKGRSGEPVTFGYVCRKGNLAVAAVATFLQDLDPTELAAPSMATMSTRVDPAGDLAGVPGWPFKLARYQPTDER